MSKGYRLYIIVFVLILGLLFVSCATFSQERIIKDIDDENFADMISIINRKIADFGDELKGTRLGEISGVSISEPLRNITIDQYLKYGVKTDEGTVFLMEEELTLPGRPLSSMGYKLSVENGTTITKYLLDKFNILYMEIEEVLITIGKNLKKSPVRLESISIDISPFGIGGSMTIEVNYESEMFGGD